MRNLLKPALLALTPFMLSACGEPEYTGTQTAEDGTEVSYKVEGNTGTMKFETDGEGTTEVAWGDAAKISDDFPKDIPVYPGLKVMASSSTPEQGLFSLQGSSEDAPEKVMAFYKKHAEDKGWTTQSSTNVGPMTNVSYKQGERAMTLTVMPGQAGMGKSIVSLVAMIED